MTSCNAYTVSNDDFTNRIDVVCPRCESKALVIGADIYEAMSVHEKLVRFSCTACGYTIKYGNTPKITIYVNSRGIPKYSRILFRNTNVDPFFGFPLWYSMEANEGLIWAYNLEHLSVIEAYIADILRERNGLPVKNNSIASRLPKWISAAKNRTYVLVLIERMRKR